MDDEDDDYYGRCHDDECGEDEFEDAEEDDRGPGWYEHQWGGPDDEDEYSEGGNEYEGDFDDDGEYCEEDDEHEDERIEMTRQFRGETGFAATVRGRIIAEASTLEWLIKGASL